MPAIARTAVRTFEEFMENGSSRSLLQSRPTDPRNLFSLRFNTKAFMNFASMVDIHANSESETPAIFSNDETITYAEFRDSANQFANLLAAEGIAEDDKIALYMPNSITYAVCFIGALKYGAVPVPVNQRLQSNEVKFVLNDSDSVILVTDTDGVETIPAIEETDVRTVFVSGSEPGATGQTYEEGLETQSTEFETVPRQNSAIASIMYTSGSTGNPKGVLQHHGFHFAIGGGRAAFYNLSRLDVGCIVSPLFHISGKGIFDMALFLGCPFVLQEQWDRGEYLGNIEAHDVTFSHLITTVLIEIADSDPEILQEYDTDSLRTIITGGGPCTEEQIRRFEQYVGGEISEGYGSTEGGYAYNPPGKRKLGSNGVPSYNMNDFKIVSPETNEEVPAGKKGEILIRGDAVTTGYYNRPDLNEQLFEDGWLHTEDLGWFDEDGYLYFTGRLDDMIKTGGENVYPAEIEQVILDIDGVAEVKVIGKADEKWGELVTAVIAPASDDLTPEKVVNASRDELAGFKIPREIYFVPELDKLGSQKVDRGRIDEIIREHDPVFTKG